MSKQQELAMSDLGTLIDDDSANSRIRTNALIKRASLFIQQCKDPVQDPLKVSMRSLHDAAAAASSDEIRGARGILYHFY